MVLLVVLGAVVELLLLIWLASKLGVLIVAAGVILSALIGLFELRRQGPGALRALRAALQQRRLPAKELADGVLLLTAGGLLILPGLLSDLAGAALMVPRLRARMAHRFSPKLPASPPPRQEYDVEGSAADVAVEQLPSGEEADGR